jgi:hypothetical protein
MKQNTFYIILISIGFLFLACDENSDGSSKSTYSSCKIVASGSMLAEDRNNDLQQCWNISDTESQEYALNQCEAKVQEYLDDTYIFNGLLSDGYQYSVQSTYCP